MFLHEKIIEINEKLKLLEDISNVVVWGAGVHTCKLFEKTDLFSYNIKGIVDIDKRKQGNKYFGFTIAGPEKVNWKEVGAVVISVPDREIQIKEILLEHMGFKEKIICLYESGRCTPFYLLYDETVPEVRYIGDYNSWDAASSECKGYDDAAIIDKVISSTKKVLAGDAVWERDGWLFYEQEYVYHICAAILKCAVQNNNQGVRILDIGGSLGSTYFQNRKYLPDVKNLEYIVAEQARFADYGGKNLEDGTLRFIDSTESFDLYGKIDIVLMSGSLQYIAQYNEIIYKVIEAKPRYVILDRILVSDRQRVCKEIVPEAIYKGSYPIMIFCENDLVNLFSPDYELIEKDVSSVPEKVYFDDGKAESKYYVFGAKENSY